MWLSKLLAICLLLLVASVARGQNFNGTATVSGPLLAALNQVTASLPQLKEPIRRLLATDPAQLTGLLRATQGLGGFLGQLQTGADLSGLLQPLKDAGILTSQQAATVAGVLPQIVKGTCFLDIATMMIGLNPNSTDTWALEMIDASGKPGPSILRGNNKFMGNYQQCGEARHADPFGLRQDIEGHICRAYLGFTIGPVTFGDGNRIPPLEWDLCLPKSCKGPEIVNVLHNLTVTQVQYMLCTAEDLDVTDDAGAVVAICILTVFAFLVVIGTVMDVYVQLRAQPGHDTHSNTISNVNHNTHSNTTPHVNQTKDIEMQETNAVQNDIYMNSIILAQGYPNYSKTVMNPNEQQMRGKTSSPHVLLTAPPKDHGYSSGDPISLKRGNGFSDITNAKSQTRVAAKAEDKIEDKERRPNDDTADLVLWQRAFLCFSLAKNTGRILSVKAARGSIGCLHGIRVLSLAWVILGHVILFMALNGGVMNKMDVFKLESTFSFQIIVNAPLAVDTFFFISGFLTAYLFMKECAKRQKVSIKTMVLYYVHRYWRLTPPMMIWIMIVATLLQYVGEGRPAWTDYAAAETCRKHWWVNMLYINNVHDDRDCVGVTWFLAHDMMYYIIAPLALVPFVYGVNVVGCLVSVIFIGIHIGSSIWLEVEYDGMDTFRSVEIYNDKMYFKPWTRIAPFAIGLLFGILMYKSNGKVKMSKLVVTLGWIMSIALCLVLTLSTYDDNNDFETIYIGNWSKEARSAFVVLQRPLWALVIGWIVVACSSGYGGFINSLLSWEGWLPLSRLSFGAYLTHMTLILYETYGQQFNSLFTLDLIIYKFLGFYVMSHAIGFLLSVFVEMPLLGLERALLK